MKIQTLVLGDLMTNCYLVSDDAGNAVVIDPAESPERILSALEGKRLLAVLLTHGHFDHVGATAGLMQAAHCPVYVHESDTALPAYMSAGALRYTDTYAEGDTLSFGNLTFEVFETPGHTPGSVCLRCENVLFAGDTLFAGACGRTDLAGGSDAQMQKSLRRLGEIPEDLTVYCGHGRATTLERERASNPYLRGAMQ